MDYHNLGEQKKNHAHTTGIESPTFAHTHAHTANIESMLTVCTTPTSHTKTTNEKQLKPKKQPFPKPQVWCAILRRHTHTKRTKKNFAGLNNLKKRFVKI
jgi:hypothetical protein